MLHAGKLADAGGQLLLEYTAAFGFRQAPAPGRVGHRSFAALAELDSSVSTYEVDLQQCTWVPGSDGMDHARLPLWMYPRQEGACSCLFRFTRAGEPAPSVGVCCKPAHCTSVWQTS
jgi:hypothetical protein